MMANEIGAWLWIFADFILVSVLLAVLFSSFIVSSLRGSRLMARLRNALPGIRQQLLGKTQQPQKTV